MKSWGEEGCDDFLGFFFTVWSLVDVIRPPLIAQSLFVSRI